MELQLPKSPNPKAAEDVQEGRQMVADADAWLAELDQLLQPGPES